MNVAAPESTYGKDAQAIALSREIVRRVEGLPGVKSVGYHFQRCPGQRQRQHDLVPRAGPAVAWRAQ